MDVTSEHTVNDFKKIARSHCNNYNEIWQRVCQGGNRSLIKFMTNEKNGYIKINAINIVDAMFIFTENNHFTAYKAFFQKLKKLYNGTIPSLIYSDLIGASYISKNEVFALHTFVMGDNDGHSFSDYDMSHALVSLSSHGLGYELKEKILADYKKAMTKCDNKEPTAEDIELAFTYMDHRAMAERAVASNDLKLLVWIIEGVKDIEYDFIIQIAAYGTFLNKREDILEYLIEESNDIIPITGLIESGDMEWIQVMMTRFKIEFSEDMLYPACGTTCEIVKFIMNNVDFEKSSRKYLVECLCNASAHGNLDVIKYVVDKLNKSKPLTMKKVFCEAANHGKIMVMKYLWKKSKKYRDIKHMNCLGQALLDACSAGYLDCVRYMLNLFISRAEYVNENRDIAIDVELCNDYYDAESGDFFQPISLCVERALENGHDKVVEWLLDE
jgi:hypothetical protein